MSDEDAKVIGHQTDVDVETYGVWGAVASDDGYGLGTPDDAKLDGDVDGGAELRVAVEDGDDTGNVVQGDPDNSVDAGSEGQTVVGGEGNLTNNDYATVDGGRDNEASGSNATVGGGEANEASGSQATVSGGSINEASGDYSFTAGRQAIANHDGAIVFGDSAASFVESQNEDEARFQMEIVAEEGINESSARAAKTNIDPIEPQLILEDLQTLEVSRWKYTDGDGNGKGRTHIGPMAEDFHDAFDVGDEETISSIDRGGVTVAAIQGLSAQLEEKDDRIAELVDKSERRDDRISELEARNVELEERVESLRADLAAIREEVVDR